MASVKESLAQAHAGPDKGKDRVTAERRAKRLNIKQSYTCESFASYGNQVFGGQLPYPRPLQWCFDRLLTELV